MCQESCIVAEENNFALKGGGKYISLMLSVEELWWQTEAQQDRLAQSVSQLQRDAIASFACEDNFVVIA